VAAVTITVRENGPYRITGPFQLVDADGNAYELPPGETVALCRCGRSATKPFCDKSHRVVGFDAAERAAR
jgi:CDGSH iron-sulfur domain-containing protein 3